MWTWTYPLVPSIPELGDTDVETDAKGKCTDEDSAHEDTCTFTKKKLGREGGNG